MSDGLSEIAGMVSDWCRFMFANYPDAIQYYGECLNDDTMEVVAFGVAAMSFFCREAGIINVYRIVSLDEAETAHYLICDYKQALNYAVYDDGKFICYDDIDEECEPADESLDYLPWLQPIPQGFFGYMSHGRVGALVSSFDRPEGACSPRLAVYGVPGQRLSESLYRLDLKRFWDLHSKGQIKTLTQDFCKGELWLTRVPLSKVLTRSSPLDEKEETLGCLSWWGPHIPGLDRCTKFVQATGLRRVPEIAPIGNDHPYDEHCYSDELRKFVEQQALSAAWQ